MDIKNQIAASMTGIDFAGTRASAFARLRVVSDSRHRFTVTGGTRPGGTCAPAPLLELL